MFFAAVRGAAEDPVVPWHIATAACTFPREILIGISTSGKSRSLDCFEMVQYVSASQERVKRVMLGGGVEGGKLLEVLAAITVQDLRNIVLKQLPITGAQTEPASVQVHLGLGLCHHQELASTAIAVRFLHSGSPAMGSQNKACLNLRTGRGVCRRGCRRLWSS